MKSLVQQTLQHWRTHNAPRMGAALSYYAMLSFVPLLLLLVTFASSLFSKDLVQGTLVSELSKILGTDAAHYIGEILRSRSIQGITLATTIITAAVTLFGAMGVFAELDQDFDALWDTPKARKVHTTFITTVWAYAHRKLIAFSFVPLLVLVLLVIIGVTVFFGAIERVVAFPDSVTLVVQIVQVVAPLVLGTALFATIYRILPNRKLPWCVLLLGALATTVLFVIGNFLILEYIKLLVHTDVFGGAASLVGLLVWVYYSSQVFFIGASFTYVYARHEGFIPSGD